MYHAVSTRKRKPPPKKFATVTTADLNQAIWHARNLAISHRLPFTVLQEDSAYLWFEYRNATHPACTAGNFRPMATALPPRWFAEIWPPEPPKKYDERGHVIETVTSGYCRGMGWTT